MKVDKKKLAMVLAPLGIAFFSLIVFGVPLVYIFGGLTAYFAALYILPWLLESTYKDDEAVARKWAKEAFFNIKRENLNLYHWESLSRFFGDRDPEDKMFAFKINRSDTSLGKPQAPLVLVVQLHPRPSFRDIDDTLKSMNEDKWEKPFSGISPKFEGAPTASAFKLLAKARTEKPKKKKKEKSEEDDDSYEGTPEFDTSTRGE